MGVLAEFKRKIVDGSEMMLKKAWGMDFPGKEETIALLNPSLIFAPKPGVIHLPEVRNVAHERSVIFAAYDAVQSRNHVWDFQAGETDSSIMRIGSILTDNTVLQTDFGYPVIFTNDYGGKYIFRDFFTPDRRESLAVKTLIAPWSHYFRKEYYMYVMRIAAKLCRIREAVPAEVFNEAIISYPLYNTTFEKDYFELMGINPERVVDSRDKKITFQHCLLGNNDDLINTNVEDIMALKRQLEPVLEQRNPNAVSGRRIYISRSGRRRVLNEKELITMLRKYDFDIYEDQQRSVAEQYRMYHNASFILGPHGSSFTNIIWSKPGTQLLELFPPRYVYNYFYYLSVILGLKYTAYCNGPIAHDYRNKTINDDILVDLGELEGYLDGCFD